jgi:hypothetical protein
LSFVEDKEHPARTAGRYVRAAGIAIKKERERLAAESAQREARQAQAAQQAPPPAPPEAAAQPTAIPQAAAAEKPGRAARPQVPPPAPKPILDKLLWIGFVIAVVATAVAALNIDTITSGTTQLVIRLVLGGIFVAVSVALLTNWQRANERLVAKLIKKFWGMDHPVTRSGRFVRRIAKDLMTLLGIVWLAIGVFEILRAFVNT